MKVHGCCGCSCHICAKGHNTGRGEHTEPCRQRFFDEWERENVEEPDMLRRARQIADGAVETVDGPTFWSMVADDTPENVDSP